MLRAYHFREQPPTMQNVLETWSGTSFLGSGKDRRRFIADYLSDARGLLEILCRLVRGERSSTVNTSQLGAPLAEATAKTPFASHQTHLSLSVLALFGIATDFAERAGIENAELDARVGDILMSIPQHLTFKALDGLVRATPATFQSCLRSFSDLCLPTFSVSAIPFAAVEGSDGASTSG